MYFESTFIAFESKNCLIFLQCIKRSAFKVLAKLSCFTRLCFCFFFTDERFLFSFSYTANAVLEGACERVIVGEMYCDIPLGLYVIRGENVVLLGELVYNLFAFILSEACLLVLRAERFYLTLLLILLLMYRT